MNVAVALFSGGRHADSETEMTSKTVRLLSLFRVESNLWPHLFLCSFSNLFLALKIQNQMPCDASFERA